MDAPLQTINDRSPAADQAPSVTNLSRRGLIGGGAALVLGAFVSPRLTRAQAEGAGAIAPKPGTRVPAFLAIHADGTIKFLSPFVEGGQGVNTGLVQIIAEELDVRPGRFTVECAPPGPDYALVNGLRLTGGSFSTRSSYEVMRRLGATARDMLVRAAAARLGTEAAELSTEDGVIVHAATGRRVSYAEVADVALRLKPNERVPLRDPKSFRYIRQPVARLDVPDKSQGRAIYAIDQKLDNMLYAAVRHAPFPACNVARVLNEDEIKGSRGIHAVHNLPGAIAVTADHWWRAKKAVEALKVEWTPVEREGVKSVSPDFSSAAMLTALKAAAGPGLSAEKQGEPDAALSRATKVIEAEYDAPYLAHAQLEPPSSLARFNPDGTLDLYVPNQMPEVFQAVAAKIAGLRPDRVNVHSPLLGGFFGRHFMYMTSNPFPQAILLAKETGRPVKVLWSREEEFGNDALRPLGFARFKAGLDAQGELIVLDATAVGEGPIGRWFGAIFKSPIDSSVVEGIVEKPYRIDNRAIAYVKVPHPTNIGFWRSVGHSMNDFFYESFLDEVAHAAGRDPFELRVDLVKHSARHTALLNAVARLSGGWRGGAYEDGGRRLARGVALASPFGSETATIAEVSVEDGAPRVHQLWIAIDPGQVVNPAIVKAQVESAALLGLSATLFEEIVYRDGMRASKNFDSYRILSRADVPKVHVAIVESGAPMGGVGEPGLPGVPPAVANAIATLTGHRVRSLPFANTRLKGA